jgi:hypothetical protein
VEPVLVAAFAVAVVRFAGKAPVKILKDGDQIAFNLQ